MSSWNAVLTNRHELPPTGAKTAMQGNPVGLPSPLEQLSDEVMDCARFLNEQLPDAPWVIETDVTGSIRITVYTGD